jgi:hypothetical protein
MCRLEIKLSHWEAIKRSVNNPHSYTVRCTSRKKGEPFGMKSQVTGYTGYGKRHARVQIFEDGFQKCHWNVTISSNFPSKYSNYSTCVAPQENRRKPEARHHANVARTCRARSAQQGMLVLDPSI